MIRYFFFFVALIVFSNQPIAQTADVTRGCFPLNVTFSPPNGQSTFFWDFGDGTFSTMANPEKIFTQAGEFTVELKSAEAGSVIGTVTINVFDKPNLDISADVTSGCAPLEVKFLDETNYPNGFTISEYSWILPNGATLNGASPEHVFPDSGWYDMSLVINSELPGCGTNTRVSDLIRVTKPVQIDYEPDQNTIVCETSLNLAINNTTVNADKYTWNWEMGNGNTYSTINPLPTLYEEEGVYEIAISAEDTLGCISTNTIPVALGPPTASFELPNVSCKDTDFSPDSVVNFDGLAYEWRAPDANISSNTVEIPTFSHNTVGQKEIELVVSTLGGTCRDSIKQTIEIEEADIDFTVIPTFSCTDSLIVSLTVTNPDLSAYNWDFGDDSTSTEMEPTHRYFIPDTLEYSVNNDSINTITLSVETANGCGSDIQKEVRIFKPNAKFEIDTSFGCTPLVVNLVDSSIASSSITNYELLDNGVSIYNAATFPNQITLTTVDTHRLSLIIEASTGCIDTSYAIPIKVGEPLATNVNISDNTPCLGDTVTINALNPDTKIEAFRFFGVENNINSCFDNDTIKVVIEDVDTFNISLTTEYLGCQSTQTINEGIIVNGQKAEIDYLITCDSTNIELYNVQDSTNLFTWNIDGRDSVNIDTVEYTFDTIGKHTIYLTANNSAFSCPDHVDSIEIEFHQLESKFELEDSILCLMDASMVEFDASPSVGVQSTCWRGYKWERSWGRPIHTAETSITESIPKGEHTMDLIVFDANGCTDTSDMTIKVFEPVPDFTFNPDNICLPATVDFTDMSTSDTTITSWSWVVQEDSQSVQNPSFMLANSGGGTSIDATLQVTDELGCMQMTTKSITIYEPESTIMLLPNQAGFCVGDTIDFSATDFTQEGNNLINWSWDFKNGTTANTQNVNDITYPNGGIYEVTLDFEESNTGCKGQATRTIEIQEIPQVDFDVDDEQCVNTSISFEGATSNGNDLAIFWNFGNGRVDGDLNVSQIYNEKGTYPISIQAATTFGCIDSASQIINVSDPRANFDLNENIICRDGEVTVTLRDTSDITSWDWDFGDGTKIEETDMQAHSYNLTSGTTVPIILAFESHPQCRKTITKQLNFHDVTANISFSVNNGTCNSIEYQFSAANSSNADIYSWDLGNGNTSSTVTANNTYAPGSYTINLNVESQALGCTDSDTITINYDSEEPLFEIPSSSHNSFTPAINGLNDNISFQLAHDGNSPPANLNLLNITEFTIFNRFGQKVFSDTSDDPMNPGWDGNFNGNQSPNDSYPYYIKYQYSDCPEKIITGDFLIID